MSNRLPFQVQAIHTSFPRELKCLSLGTNTMPQVPLIELNPEHSVKHMSISHTEMLPLASRVLRCLYVEVCRLSVQQEVCIWVKAG